MEAMFVVSGQLLLVQMVYLQEIAVQQQKATGVETCILAREDVSF